MPDFQASSLCFAILPHALQLLKQVNFPQGNLLHEVDDLVSIVDCDADFSVVIFTQSADGLQSFHFLNEELVFQLLQAEL